MIISTFSQGSPARLGDQAANRMVRSHQPRLESTNDWCNERGGARPAVGGTCREPDAWIELGMLPAERSEDAEGMCPSMSLAQCAVISGSSWQLLSRVACKSDYFSDRALLACNNTNRESCLPWDQARKLTTRRAPITQTIDQHETF